MAVSKGLGTYGDGAGVVTPTDHKLAHLGLVSKTGAGTNTVRAGLFYDGVTTIVSGTANMSYDVAPFTAVSSRGAAAGAVFFANDGTVNVVTTAAPGTNSRIDVVYAWQREFSLDGGSTAPEIGVVQGTAAASPVAPSLSAYPGAIELARITVPAGVTATNSGTTITQTAPFTALDGAPIPVRSVSSLPATAVTGARARTIDTGLNYEWSGSAWAPVGNGYEFRQTLRYPASSAFTKASYPWLRAIRVMAYGGGGGGGGSATLARGAGGGGGGGYAESFITDIAGLASSVTITVPAAAAATSGATGNSGGTVSFGELVVATGGSGGGANGVPGEAGVGTSGDVLVRGQAGQNGSRQLVDASANSGYGGAGGRAAGRIGGGGGVGSTPGSYGSAGTGGYVPGGGGAGANTNTATAVNGGAGARGELVIELYA